MAFKKQANIVFSIIVLLAVISLFSIHAYSLNFTQDDAFIIYRYAKNFANGHGLVFNIGERVEGYTSFSWTLLMAVAIRLGFDPVAVSKILGFLLSVGSILVLFLISNLISKGRNFVFNVLACLMIAANGSFAMWTMSGMETPLFVFLILCAIYSYVLEHYRDRYELLTPVLFSLVSLTRPEGVFLFALTFVHRLYSSLVKKRFRLSNHIQWLGVFFILLFPFFLWRLSYYGYPLPNTFYAKSGMSWIYVQMGFEYTATFLRQYALWGVALVGPLVILFFRKDRFWYGYFSMLILSFLLYVTLIGGDVLLENRFYIPVLFLMYVFVQESLYDAYIFFGKRKKVRKTALKSAVAFGIFFSAVLYSGWTYYYPLNSIRTSKHLMEEVVEKFNKIAEWVHSQGKKDASLATTGVGAVSYFSDIRVIDMYGMTDAYIAHYPQKIEGLTSTTKEQKYNISYVLSRKPTYIHFITNLKPSALAEKALFTSAEFRQGYYPYWIDENHIIYIRKETYTPKPKEFTTYTAVEFIDEYCRGLNNKDANPLKAVEHFQNAIDLGPRDFSRPYEQAGICYVNYLSDHDKAIEYCTRAVEIDDYCALAHAAVGAISILRGDVTSAQAELQKAISLWPNYSSAHYYFGKTLVAMQKFDEAVQEFHTSIRLDKTYFLPYMDLGLLYSDHLNRPETALKYLDFFLKVFPEGNETKLVREKINEIRSVGM
ncbi:MAG: hypothetical protein JSV84_18345 [Gemmatimonadota bacterium]|nr:MAG: hypothetical protein JSV84_18345 [Gemmatimonadota bacterium]